jgi:glycosyltransferase involved in cell wall biosynthesis
MGSMTIEPSRRGARFPWRILEVETFGRGGLIHYAYNLSCALADRGHEVVLATSAAYELDSQAAPAGLRVVKAIDRGGANDATPPSGRRATWSVRLQALRGAFAVAALARRWRPDVVHLHCTNQIALAYIILFRLTGVPVVTTAHVVTPHERSGLQDAIWRRVHRASRRIVAHSEFDRHRLQREAGIDPARVAVVPHGDYGFFGRDPSVLDRDAARQSLGLEPGQEVALFFGYLREYKGLDLLLDAWPAVAAARPHARLVIAGDPVRLEAPRREALVAAAVSVGAVHRFGYVPFADVPRYFAAADVLVLPYRHVSQSGVLYAALALGVPVVATRVGAFPEVLADGENALLVAPEDPAAIATAVTRLLGDADLRRRLSDGGRRVAEAHSWPNVARLTEDVFDGVVRGAMPSDQRARI